MEREGYLSNKVLLSLNNRNEKNNCISPPFFGGGVLQLFLSMTLSPLGFYFARYLGFTVIPAILPLTPP